MPQRIEQPFRELVRRYHRLSPTARSAVWVLLAFEVVLIGVAERDIQRRPADQIRGPKLLWRAAATQNVIRAARFPVRPPPRSARGGACGPPRARATRSARALASERTPAPVPRWRASHA